MLGDHGEVSQVALAIVDEAVLVALGAVVDRPGRHKLKLPVAQHLARAGQNADDLAVRLVSVQADGTAGGQEAPRDLYILVQIRA